MRKTVVLAVLALLLDAPVAAAVAKVTSPNGGETWLANSKHLVTWTGGSGQARLVLFQSGKGKIGAISPLVPLAPGSWEWTVGFLKDGDTVPGGEGYLIAIVKENGTEVDRSDAPFRIGSLDTRKFKGPASLPPAALAANIGLPIRVSSPVAGSSFKPGAHVDVVWSTAGIQSYPQVLIDVYRPDRTTAVGSIGSSNNPIASWPNSGKCDAHIFYERYEVGKQYVLRVATPDGKHVGFSGVFTIAPLQAVSETEELRGSAYHVEYRKSERYGAPVPGCLYEKSEKGPKVPEFTHPVGIHNIMDDPAGPCWQATGLLYRTFFKFEGVRQGWAVTKAELRFTPQQGTKQPLTLFLREGASDSLNVPMSGIATDSSWEFGQTVAFDVTAAVQAWCAGKKPNNGFILRGQESGWGGHNDVHAAVFVELPTLVVTQTVER